MTRKRKHENAEGELQEALAVLISSTRSKTRPIPLTEIARWLDVAVRELGGYPAVAERIGLSSKMLRQFSYVRRLSKTVQKLFERRELDSVDAATHLAMLPPGEQHVLAKALASGKIDTSDLRAVVELRKLGSRAGIASLLKKVSASRPTKEYVAEFVVRGSHSADDLLIAFKRYIPASEIVRLELKGALGRLVLTHRGKLALADAARRLRVPLKQVISTILRSATSL